MTIKLEKAELPQPKRKAKESGEDNLKGWQNVIRSTWGDGKLSADPAPAPNDGWTSTLEPVGEARKRAPCCGRDLVFEGCFCGYSGVEANLTFLIGGPMNGQRLDLTSLGNARIVRVPNPNQQSFEWYELGDKESNCRYHCGSDSDEGLYISERLL